MEMVVSLHRLSLRAVSAVGVGRVNEGGGWLGGKGA